VKNEVSSYVKSSIADYFVSLNLQLNGHFFVMQDFKTLELKNWKNLALERKTGSSF
jgi:hypothetical protein